MSEQQEDAPRVPQELARFNLNLPPQCVLHGNVLDLEHHEVTLTLTHKYASVPLICGNTRVVKLVAIVCEEYSLHDCKQFVGVNVAKPFTDLLQPRIRHLDLTYLDRLLPGTNQFKYRVWYACPSNHKNHISNILPQLTLDQCYQGIVETLHPNGYWYYHVTYEMKSNNEAICPLGYITKKMIEGKLYQRVYPPKEVKCPDKIERMGYEIPKEEAKKTLAMMLTWVNDPRPAIPLKTFSIRGSSEAEEWTLNLRLHVFFAVHG